MQPLGPAKQQGTQQEQSRGSHSPPSLRRPAESTARARRVSAFSIGASGAALKACDMLARDSLNSLVCKGISFRSGSASTSAGRRSRWRWAMSRARCSRSGDAPRASPEHPERDLAELADEARALCAEAGVALSDRARGRRLRAGPARSRERRSAEPAEPAGLDAGAGAAPARGSARAARATSRTTRTRRRSPSGASAPAAASSTSSTSRCRRASAPVWCWAGACTPASAGRQGRSGTRRSSGTASPARAAGAAVSRPTSAAPPGRGASRARRPPTSRVAALAGAPERARPEHVVAAAREGDAFALAELAPLQRLSRARAHVARLRARARSHHPRHDPERRRRGAVSRRRCARRCSRGSGRCSDASCGSWRAGSARGLPFLAGICVGIDATRAHERARRDSAAQRLGGFAQLRDRRGDLGDAAACSSGCFRSARSMVSPTPALARSCERVFFWIERIISVIASVLLVM